VEKSVLLGWDAHEQADGKAECSIWSHKLPHRRDNSQAELYVTPDRLEVLRVIVSVPQL